MNQTLRRVLWVCLAVVGWLAVSASPAAAVPDQRGWGYCASQINNTPGVPQDISVNCTVTVYLTGTQTKASLFLDANETMPTTNPIVADTNGYYFFYAANGTYDVQLSGGVPAIGPYTLAGIQLGATSGGGGTSCTGTTGQIVYMSSPSTCIGAAGITTSNGSNLTVAGNVAMGGPSPYTDATAVGMRTIAAPQTITVTTSAGSPTVTTTGIGDFQAKDGIAIPAAGATTSQSTPSAPTIAVRGATGAATINYECVGVDRLWGLTAASAAGTATTAPAPFGWAAVGITSIARAGNVVTVTSSSTLPVSSGSYSAVIANVTGGSTQFSGLQSVTVTSGTTLTYSQNGANESGTVSSSSYILFENAYILTTVAATAGSNQLVLTTSVNHNIIAGDATRPTKIFLDGINFSGESPAGFADGVFPVLSVTANTITIQTPHTAVATANGAANLSYATSGVAQMTATVVPIVDVTCPAIGGTTVYYAVYGNYGSGYAPIGFTPFNTNVFEDYGPAYSQTGFTPPPAMALPATPPVAAQRQVFAGQISSIVGSTLTLGSNVTAAVTSVTGYHDEGTAFLAALTANPRAPLYLPRGSSLSASYIFNAPVDMGSASNRINVVQGGPIVANGTLYADDSGSMTWRIPADLYGPTEWTSGAGNIVSFSGLGSPLMTSAGFTNQIQGISFSTNSNGQTGFVYLGQNPSTLSNDAFSTGTTNDLTTIPLFIENSGFALHLHDLFFDAGHDVEYPVPQSGNNTETGQAAWWPVPSVDVVGPNFPVIVWDGVSYGLFRGLQIDDALYGNTGNAPQITISQIQTFQDPWQPFVQVWGDSGSKVGRLDMRNVQMDSNSMPNGACISVDGLSCVISLTTDSQRGNQQAPTWSGSPSNSAFEIIDLNEYPAQNTNETYVDAAGNVHTTSLVGTNATIDTLAIPGATSGSITMAVPAVAGTNTATFPANTGTLAELNLAQTWTANQTSMPLVNPTLIEGAAPSGVSGQDLLYGLTTSHWPAFNANNGGARAMCGSTGTVTSGHIVAFNTSGTNVCDLVDGGTGTGSGSVTNFSVTGSPCFVLFTCGVANPGTTPALTFTITNFSAHNFYGNNTGSSAAPAASLIGTSDVSPNEYAAGGGTADAQTVALSPAATAWTAGLVVRWLPSLANLTTTPTINPNGLGAKTITKNGTAALLASDLTTTAVATCIYDGTECQLQNPQTGGTGANAALSNLAAVAVNTALLPGTTNSIALGSATKTWSDLFVGSASSYSHFSSAATAPRLVSLPDAASATAQALTAGTGQFASAFSATTGAFSTKTLTNSTGASGINWTDNGTQVTAALASVTGGGNATLQCTQTGGTNGQYYGISGGICQNITPGVVPSSRACSGYTVAQSDLGTPIFCTDAGAAAVTLNGPGSYTANFFFCIKADAAGTVTITATGNIEGGATLAISTKNHACVYNNGTTWFALTATGF